MSKLRDLSRYSKPVGNFIKKIPSKSEWNKYRLSAAQLHQYERNGFLPNVPVLSSDQVETLINDYSLILNAVNEPNQTALSSWSDAVNSTTEQQPNNKDVLSLLHEYHSNETGDENNLLFHCLGHWRITEGFHDLIFHPSITVPCAQLLYIDSKRDYHDNTEPKTNIDHDYDNYDEVCVRFWHDQLFAKPPSCGGNVAWHQDYSYWTRTKPMQHITVHIALDEQNEENGAISYIPGSHEWYRKDLETGAILPLPITDLHFIDMESIFSILSEKEKQQWHVESCKLKPGEAVFHHALSVHGSFPNRSKAARRAAVLNYFRDGTYSNTDEALLSGIDVVPKGHKLQTAFNPVVYDPLWKEG
eukprot:122625_1